LTGKRATSTTAELTQRATGNLHKQRVADATGPSFFNPATGRVECGTLKHRLPAVPGTRWFRMARMILMG
jgi:hypothetical protein